MTATHLVAEVSGYYTATSSFVGVLPARLFETCSGLSTFDRVVNGIGLRAAGSVTELTVAGRGGVAVDAAAVVLNVTVTEPQGAGFVTVFRCADPIPTASSLNL